MSDWAPEDGWFVVAADATSRAQEAYEELLGYRGSGNETVDMLEGEKGHKPPRADIQKYKTAYEEYEAHKRRASEQPSLVSQPPETFNERYEKLQEMARAWEKKSQLTIYDQSMLDFYKRLYTIAHDTGEPQPAQHAFEHTIQALLQNGYAASMWAQEHEQTFDRPPDQLEPSQAKQLLGGALKRYEYSQYPKLYRAVEDTLADLYRRTSDENETYKLWPWAVSELKRQFAGQSTPDHLGIWDEHNWPIIGTRWPGPSREHLVDIVDQTGGLLNRMRQEHRLPQGLDANQFKSTAEMENWLMQYRRENGEGDDGGKTVHSFDDGWTVQQLHQPNQLEWEGDQMNHCVGGYWQPVRDGQSYIYSFRDHENKPHATLEFKPHGGGDAVVQTPLWELVGMADDPETKKNVQALKGKGQGVYEMPLYNSADEWQTMRDLLDQDDQDSTDESTAAIRAESARHPLGAFTRARVAPFEESGKQLYTQPHARMNNTHFNSVIPAEGQEKRAILAQHMGPSDNMPDSQANSHIRDWLDHHRSNGWEIERQDGFFWPNGWDEHGAGSYPDGWRDEDYGNVAGIRNTDRRSGTGAAEMLKDWYDDHFRQNPARWTGQPDEHNPVDKYGFPITQDEDDDPMPVNWDDTNNDVMRALADDYDRDVNHVSDWEGLARAYWHAYHLDGPLVEGDAERRQALKSSFETRVNDWQNELDDQHFHHWYDYYAGTPEVIADTREKYRELGGPVPPNEDDPEEENDSFDGGDEGVDEDLWREAEDARRYQDAESLYGRNYKFFNYLYWLNEKHGPMTPRELHEHAVNGTFPKWEDVKPPDSIPGALSHVAAEMPDWMMQPPQGQWYKWGYHPNYGALLWEVNGPDGDKADRMADRSHIDQMNKTWARPGRYPFDPADHMGVAFHNPETNTFHVTQYPRGPKGLAHAAWPYLQQQIMQHHPGAQIDWPTEVNHLHRTGEFEATPTYNPTLTDGAFSQGWMYDPTKDEFHWGNGHAAITSRLYRMGYEPTTTRNWPEGRVWPEEGRVEHYKDMTVVPDRPELTQRVLQEAAQKPWEQPSGFDSPWMAAEVEHPDPEFAEVMRRAYSGDLVDLEEARNRRRCPVCDQPVDRSGFPTCRACGWKEGDPIQTCPTCGAKNSIELAPNSTMWPLVCRSCQTRYTPEELEDQTPDW